MALYSAYIDATWQTEETVVFAPIGSPRILHDPILAVGFINPIANQEHSVVQFHERIEEAGYSYSIKESLGLPLMQDNKIHQVR